MADGTIHVVGLHGGVVYGSAAAAALVRADVIVGSARHLDAIDVRPGCERVDLAVGLDSAIETIEARRSERKRVTVLASGDPGFFGIVRLLGERFGPERLRVHPAPSSVSLAFAHAGLSWDDAVIVSAHGRSLDHAVGELRTASKAAVLTSPDNPPELVGKALLDLGAPDRDVLVVSRLGEPDEAVHRCDVAGLAAGTFDPMSVVVLVDGSGIADTPALSWGQPVDAFEHRAGMITKPEVRAVVLSKLALPRQGVLWDVGAGSGSVGIEAALLSPGLHVFAIERAPDDVDRIRANAAQHRARVEVVAGEAPASLTSLPDPDRVFVGGGGPDVIDAALARLRPGGVLVATHALLDRAAWAWERLGNLVELSVGRGTPIAGGVHLQGENPVFVTWGPQSG